MYRREGPEQSDNSICHLVHTTNPKIKSRESSPTTYKKNTYKPPKIIAKKDSATKKQSNSGIPLRLKSKTNISAKAQTKSAGTYHRHAPVTSNLGPVINKNTLEVQFINNKKRLLQLHAELNERQRPLLDMHKSLLRTKKQLEDLGKKVVLEDLKIVTLKVDGKQLDLGVGAGETPAIETAINLKSSIDNVLDSCVKVCQKCFVKRDDVVKMLESLSRSETEASEIEIGVEELKREQTELEKNLEDTVSESEKKIEEVINNWQKSVVNKFVNEDMISKIGELEDKVKLQQKALSDAEEHAHSLNRKLEDKKATLEKTISEFQEKINVRFYFSVTRVFNYR